MHCTAKKTVETIIEQGNDYVITVKANQPSLHQHLCTISQSDKPVSVYQQSEHSHQRCIERTVEVFDNVSGIVENWVGVRRFIRVQRQGTRQGNPYQQVSYYLSSLATTARQFAEGIRGHWGIENRLHWVKDVVLGEDQCPLKHRNAPANWGLFRTWAVSLFRLHGEPSITKAQRRVAHDINALFLLIQ